MSQIYNIGLVLRKKVVYFYAGVCIVLFMAAIKPHRRRR